MNWCQTFRCEIPILQDLLPSSKLVRARVYKMWESTTFLLGVFKSNSNDVEVCTKKQCTMNVHGDCSTLTYGSVVWWPRVVINSVLWMLNKVQYMTRFEITGAMKSTIAIELVLDFLPLSNNIKWEAFLSANRYGTWIDTAMVTVHRTIFSYISAVKNCIGSKRAHIWFSSEPPKIIPRKQWTNSFLSLGYWWVIRTGPNTQW